VPKGAAKMKTTDIRIDEVSYAFEDFRYRTPIKFGGVASDRVTILNVECAVHTRDGKRARGFGSMPMGNIWSFPSKTLGYDQTLAAMKDVVERVAAITRACPEFGHPIDLTWAMEHDYTRAAQAASEALGLADQHPGALHACLREPVRRRFARRFRKGARAQLLSHLRSGLHES